MRDKIYLTGFLVLAGILLLLGKDVLASSVLVTWGLTFGGTTALAVLLVLSYRLRLELRASRHELARKEAELNFALEVQKSLFPRQLPQHAGMEFSAACIPARGIGGDYYDIIRLPDNRLALAIADISGKGISAAILMANLQAMLRIFATMGTDPRGVCERLNWHLHDVTDDSKFATFFYGEWHPLANRFRYVNAGHNCPILLDNAGSRRLHEGGMPLGIFPSADYDVGEVVLTRGDILVLYSDGITESTSRSGSEFGEARLEAIIAAHRSESPAVIKEEVLHAVREWSGREPEDDMTLLVARATGSLEERK